MAALALRRLARPPFAAVAAAVIGITTVAPAEAAPDSTRSDAEQLFESLEAIDQMSLADLLESETRVASVTPFSQRASPGILTIVTREEILDSGARDLIDVLRRVPGFDFGSDVQGVLGAGFRGIWGHEGKVLLLVDGHELNEGLYLTTQFGNHFPVDQIEKIEIVRGPGSAVYGGTAELAVVNVITRRGGELEGPAASLRYGHMDGGFARRTLSLAYGQTLEQLDGLRVSASGYLGQARTSGLPYSDFYGESFSMRESSGTEPAYLNLNAAWRGLELSYLYDGYKILDRTSFGESFPYAGRVEFPGHYLSARYDLKLGEALTLTPRLRYKRQRPWRFVEPDPELQELAGYDPIFERFEAGLTASWRALGGLDVVGGLVAQLDRANLSGEPSESLSLLFGDSEAAYGNLALFAQGSYLNPIVNLTAGARYERHSLYGDSFVPRAGLTKVLGDLHLKALYSDAFKAPGIENIAANPDIRPEKTRVVELEAGYLFGKQLYAAVNVFDISVDGPIVYGVDVETGEESYVNYESTGVRGAEATLRYKGPRLAADLGYTYYHSGKNEVPVFAVPGEDQVLLGLAQHKLTASARIEALPRLKVSPSLVFLSGRYGYTGADDEGTPLLERTPAVWLLDLYVSYRPARFDGLTVGAGVYNLLDQRVDLLQPYDGGHAPIPDMGREIAIRLAYEH